MSVRLLATTYRSVFRAPNEWENNQNTVNSQRLVFEFMASHISHWQIIISEQAVLAGTLLTNENAIYLQGRVVCGTFIIFTRSRAALCWGKFSARNTESGRNSTPTWDRGSRRHT